MEKNNTKKNTKRKITKSEMRRILADAEFDVISNDNALLFYRCSRTGQELTLAKYGDRDSISFDMLSTMKQSARNFLEKYWIIIEDIYIPNSDVVVTVEDVYEYLGLSNVYKEINKCFDSVDNLEYLLLETDNETFDKQVEAMDKKMFNQLVALAIELFNAKKLVDQNKIMLIKSYAGDEYLFEQETKNKKSTKK